MKKVLSLTLVVVMLLSTLVLTSCDLLSDFGSLIGESHTSTGTTTGTTKRTTTTVKPTTTTKKEEVKKTRTTISKDEWNAMVNAENYTITCDYAGTMDEITRYTRLGYYINNSLLGEETALFIENSVYLLSQEDGEWVARLSEMTIQDTNVLFVWSYDVPWDDLVYDEVEKAYISGNRSFYFEEGVIVKLVISYNSRYLEYLISDFNSTHIEFPSEYTFAE